MSWIVCENKIPIGAREHKQSENVASRCLIQTRNGIQLLSLWCVFKVHFRPENRCLFVFRRKMLCLYIFGLRFQQPWIRISLYFSKFLTLFFLQIRKERVTIPRDTCCRWFYISCQENNLHDKLEDLYGSFLSTMYKYMADFTSVTRKKIFMRSLKIFMVRFCRLCLNTWTVAKKKIFMRSLKIFMVRFCQPCTNIRTLRVWRCIWKTKTKPPPPPKLRGKRGIMLGKEPKEKGKQKKSPNPG